MLFRQSAPTVKTHIKFGGFVTHIIFDKKDVMANKVKSMLQILHIPEHTHPLIPGELGLLKQQ